MVADLNMTAVLVGAELHNLWWCQQVAREAEKPGCGHKKRKGLRKSESGWKTPPDTAENCRRRGGQNLQTQGSATGGIVLVRPAWYGSRTILPNCAAKFYFFAFVFPCTFKGHIWLIIFQTKTFFVNNFTARISHLSWPAVGSVRLRSRPGPARPRCYCGAGARYHSTVLLRSQSCRAKLDPSTELSLSPARDQDTTWETFRSGNRPFDPFRFFQVATCPEAFQLFS